MRALISFEQAKYLDYISQTIYKIPELILMERAGMACARVLIDAIAEHNKQEIKILVLCGSGNNGGDAIVVARELFSKSYKVQVCILGEANTNVSKVQREILLSLAIPVLSYEESIANMSELRITDWIVDGLSGIGLQSPYRDSQYIACVNASEAKILAIDVPSGMLESQYIVSSAESVNVIDHPLIFANITITMGIEKTAMYVHSQRQNCGKIIIADDVFPCSAIEHAKNEAYIYEDRDIAQLMPLADLSSYKHSRGVLAIAAGCTESPGAAILTTQAAQKGPAGLIYTLIDEELRKLVVSQIPVAVSGRALDSIKILHAICAGSGWGKRAVSDLEKLLSRRVPTVLDADALHMFDACNRYDNNSIILTPHLGELRMLVKNQKNSKQNTEQQSSTDTVPNGEEKDGNKYWWQQAQAIADNYNVVVCAKNSVSYIAAPKCLPIIVDGNNPIMACGGNGDVLAGLIASVVAYFVGTGNLVQAEDQRKENIALLQQISALAALIHQRAGKIVLNSQGTGNASDVVQAIAKSYSIHVTR